MCDVCKQTPCHNMCPNAEPRRVVGYCSICQSEILEGEEVYPVSDDESVHCDSIQDFTMEELLELTNTNPSDTFRQAGIDGDLIMQAFGIYKTEAK